MKLTMKEAGRMFGNRTGDSGILLLGIIVLVIVLIVFLPLIWIWALNTLFPVLAIPTNFWTWLAMLLVTGIFKSNITTKSKS